MNPFKIIGKATVAFYEELFFYFILGMGHILSWLLILPGPFLLAGVYTIGQKAVRGLGVKWNLIWEGIKEFGLRSLLLFLVVLFGYVVIAVNLWFYNAPDVSPFPRAVAAWTTPLFVALALLWTGITFYAQAFLMELEEPTLGMALRNSLFLTLLKPFHTLLFVVVSLVILVLSIGFPVLLIFSPGLLSALALTAVRTLVTGLAEKLAAEEEETDETGEGE